MFNRSSWFCIAICTTTTLLISPYGYTQTYDFTNPESITEQQSSKEKTWPSSRGLKQRYVAHREIQKLNPAYKEYEAIALREAAKHDLDPRLILAIIQVESSFDKYALSVDGAAGLMQLTADVLRALEITDPFDPAENIGGGVAYLVWLLKKYDGNIELALAAYNAGPGAVDRYKGVPPFRETRNFIKRIGRFTGRDLSLRKTGVMIVSDLQSSSGANSFSQEDANSDQTQSAINDALDHMNGEQSKFVYSYEAPEQSQQVQHPPTIAPERPKKTIPINKQSRNK